MINYLPKLVMGLAVILLAARIGGKITERIFKGKEGESFVFYEALNPETSRVLTRIQATHPTAEEVIHEADRLFNESRKFSYMRTSNHDETVESPLSNTREPEDKEGALK